MPSPPSPSSELTPRRASAAKPLLCAIVTAFVVTVLSYVLPAEYAATGVGLAFLAATYWCALRSDDPDAARRYGLSLGGLLDPEPVAGRRLVADAARAIAVAVLIGLVFFPPFWAGYVLWWQPRAAFLLPSWPGFVDEALGQWLVIALPEEAFYRGYLQTALDEAWPRRIRVLGADLGPSVVVASALFAVGHVATEIHPSRLSVFFPALVFGWLRARTGGIGAGVAFHALCNLFASFLARSYGFI